MAEFTYEALSANGAVTRGTYDATTEQAVIEYLRKQGLSPLKIAQKSSLSLQGLLQTNRKVGQAHVVLFTQQLATMINAGLPIERALQLLITLTDHRELKSHLEAILAQVRDGVPFSDALENRSGLVSKLYISMMRAGETGGALGKTLVELSDYLSRAQDLQRGLISAMIYPIILLIMAVGSVFALLTFVVPSFAPMFEELGADMPGITKVVLSSGAFLQNYWWAFIGFVIVAIVLWKQAMARVAIKQQFDRWLISFGKVGDLIMKMETTRFTRTLGALLGNGVPILRGMALASEVIKNTAFEVAVQRVAEQVKSGRSLADAMSEVKYFPSMAQQMLVVGEETGELGEILIRVADTYDKEVKVTLDRLLEILVPVMILTLSMLIATIVISILMAILSVNDLFG